MNFGIIGAGPAGIFAALTIKNKNVGNEVHLFDGNQKIGRKLFATGNGRCNITNMAAGPRSYYSVKPEDLTPVFNAFPPRVIREKLDALGIPTTATEDGWVYPQSSSAANVVQILADALTAAGVHIHTSTRIQKIDRTDDGRFLLSSENGEANDIVFDRILLTSGSKAFPSLGANTTVLSEFFKFDIHDLNFVPALAPISAKGDIFKKLTGVRMDAEVTLLREQEPLGKTVGNLIFTDYGLNGPAVMNLTHLIQPKDEAKYAVKLNFLPDTLSRQLDTIFYSHIKQNFPYRSVFLSLLPMKLVEYFFKIWKIDWDTSCERIDSRTFRVHIKRLQGGIIPIEGVRDGFTSAQAAAGGIPLAEVNLRTMQSRKVKGLYFAGEVLDVVGPCGGYNLTWAVATGLLAGTSAASSAS